MMLQTILEPGMTSACSAPSTGPGCADRPPGATRGSRSPAVAATGWRRWPAAALHAPPRGCRTLVPITNGEIAYCYPATGYVELHDSAWTFSPTVRLRVGPWGAVIAAHSVLEATCVAAATGFLYKTVALDERSYPYCVYVPPEYTPEKPWPVILFLHGSGECGDDGFLQTDVGIGRAIRQIGRAHV